MFQKQNKKCANLSCNKEIQLNDRHKKDTGFVDHCHKTGKIRGILCQTCNSALGQVYDNVEILKGLIKYLNES